MCYTRITSYSHSIENTAIKFKTSVLVADNATRNQNMLIEEFLKKRELIYSPEQ